jgi:hypothetical protein
MCISSVFPMNKTGVRRLHPRIGGDPGGKIGQTLFSGDYTGICAGACHCPSSTRAIAFGFCREAGTTENGARAFRPQKKPRSRQDAGAPMSFPRTRISRCAVGRATMPDIGGSTREGAFLTARCRAGLPDLRIEKSLCGKTSLERRHPAGFVVFFCGRDARAPCSTRIQIRLSWVIRRAGMSLCLIAQDVGYDQVR